MWKLNIHIFSDNFIQRIGEQNTSDNEEYQERDPQTLIIRFKYKLLKYYKEDSGRYHYVPHNLSKQQSNENSVEPKCNCSKNKNK